MSDLNELKTLVLTLAQRVSSLETLMRTSASAITTTDTSAALGVSRLEEPINKLVNLGYRGDKCLLGIQTNKTDKHIPIVELNLFNLKAFIVDMETALRTGDNKVVLKNYKQHTDYAQYHRGSWEIVS